MSSELQLKIAAQQGYCTINNQPLFISKDSFCFSCGKQTFEKISLQEASTKLITGCPYCNQSYVD